jgi:Uroporphyrinogen-III decarboxylase
MDMKRWLEDLKVNKRVLPILSFPVVQLLDCSLKDFLNDSTLQAQGIQLVSERCHTGIGLGIMDLSIEAECFGAKIRFEDNEIPTVVGALIEDECDIETPDIIKRAKVYVETIKKTKLFMKDKPVFAGIIGPFSLCGRLLDVSEALALCYEDPDLVHQVLKVSTEFVMKYAKALKEAGADGIIMAEPLAGILSPSLVQEFSSDYVKMIVEELQNDEFIIIYHNCGNNVTKMIDSIISTKCAAYHFGNAISMKEALKQIPSHELIMGNIDPVGILKDGNPTLVKEAVHHLMEECQEYDNFILSSGCDIPCLTPWENIDCFIQVGNQYYEKNNS